MAPPPASTSTAAAAAADLPAASASASAAFGAPPPSPASSGAAIRQRLIDLRAPAIAHPHQLLTLTCYVPPSTIGSVIGRRGQAVLALQREATKRSGGASGTVRVSVVGSGMSPAGGAGGAGGGGGPPAPAPIPHHARRAHADPASEWAPVVIRADPVGAFAAARLLTRDVGGPDRVDDVVVDVPVHRSRHAGLIGRKGLVIAGLSAEHGVRIMVPQKRGGPQPQPQPQVLSAKQGGGGGGGEEMLFPGTEGSDRKKSGGRGGARNINNKGGKAAAAAAKYEDESDFEDNDDENRQEASGAGAGYQSHRPTNVNIVQLEGQLDDVEQCLVKVLAIAAGAGAGTGGGSSNAAGGGAGGKIKSADGRGEGRAADDNAGANADATATDTKKMTRAEKLKKKKEEKKAKAKAEKEAAAAAAAAAAAKAKAADNGAGEVAPEDEAQTGDIPMDIEIKAKDNAAAAAAADDAAAAAKEPKYSFAVVNAATDETAHLMPSLRKLQALAKSTGAKIRRRKIGESTGDGDGGGGKRGGEANVPTDNDAGEDVEEKADEEEMEKAADGDAGDDEEDNGEAENEEEEEIADDDAEADDASPGKQEITITGKTETVKAAISALEDIFGEGGCTYTLDALKTRKKKNGKRGGHQFRGKKKKKGGPGTKE